MIHSKEKAAVFLGGCHGIQKNEWSDIYIRMDKGDEVIAGLRQGNIVTNDKEELVEHAHGMFSYLRQESGEMACLGGHLLSAWVSYTAEIVLDIVEDRYIGQQFEPVTGINVWKLEGKS